MKQQSWLRLFFCLFNASSAWCMFHKRALPDENEDPRKRFRENLADLFLSNDVSGQRAVSLFADAELAGCANVKDLAKGSKFKGNNSRDLTRRLTKRRLWPKLYFTKVPRHKK